MSTSSQSEFSKSDAEQNSVLPSGAVVGSEPGKLRTFLTAAAKWCTLLGVLAMGISYMTYNAKLEAQIISNSENSPVQRFRAALDIACVILWSLLGGFAIVFIWQFRSLSKSYFIISDFLELQYTKCLKYVPSIFFLTSFVTMGISIWIQFVDQYQKGHLKDNDVYFKAIFRCVYYTVGLLPTHYALWRTLEEILCLTGAIITEIGNMNSLHDFYLERQTLVFNSYWRCWLQIVLLTISVWTLSYTVYLWTNAITNYEWAMAIIPCANMVFIVFLLSVCNEKVSSAYNSKAKSIGQAGNLTTDQFLLINLLKTSGWHYLSIFGYSPFLGTFITVLTTGVLIPALVQLFIWLFTGN